MEDEFQKRIDKILGCRQGIDNTMKSNKMYMFLLDKALEKQGRSLKVSLGIEEPKDKYEGYYCVPSIKYSETICDDYDVEKHFDDTDKSYIYRVAVLSVIDGNKSDWVHFYVGIQREKEDNTETFQFIGELYFPDGENTDIDRTLKSIAKNLEECWW